MIDHDNEDHEHARVAEHHASCASNPGLDGEADAILTASDPAVDAELRRLGVDPVAVGERGEAFVPRAIDSGPWFWTRDRLDEQWSSGPFETREAAEEDARSSLDDSGIEDFIVATGTPCDPASYVPDAEDIVEIMAQRAVDNGGPPEDWPDAVSPEAEAELDKFLEAWARKHFPTGYHCIDGDPIDCKVRP